MNFAQLMVKEFHEKFGCDLQEFPNVLPSEETVLLRLKLMVEELHELHDAMLRVRSPLVSFVDYLTPIADALVDLLYVVYGTACVYGIDAEPIFAEVHNTNMAKVGGGQREDGKILKPEGWQAPRIKELLETQILKGQHRGQY